MSVTQPTLDDVWRLFQETDRKFQETDRKFQETDRKFQETERRFQETERMFQEAERRFQETERLLKEQAREVNREIKKMVKTVEKLGHRLGDYIEESVRPAAVRLFRQRGIDVHEVQQNVTAKRYGESFEVDLLVTNDEDVIAIECKSLLSIDDVNEHLKRLSKLKRLLPRYARARVFGAVAAMVIPDQVARYAHDQGLFVIGQSGEQLVIRNDAAFRPREW